jgi:hypothetical protein
LPVYKASVLGSFCVPLFTITEVTTPPKGNNILPTPRSHNAGECQEGEAFETFSLDIALRSGLFGLVLDRLHRDQQVAGAILPSPFECPHTRLGALSEAPD